MDTKHLDELATWLKNNIDIEQGTPVIFGDYCQKQLEQRLMKG